MNRPHRLIVIGVGLVALAGTASCATVTKYAVGEAAEAITGEEVDLDDGGYGSNSGRSLQGGDGAGTEAPAAVYEAGPTPGWERGFRAHTALGSAHYQNRVCVRIPLKLNLAGLWPRQLSDPFDSSDDLDSPLLVQENSQGIDPGYTRLGEVGMGGPSPTATIFTSEGPLGAYASTGVACPLFGLVSSGRPSALALILR